MGCLCLSCRRRPRQVLHLACTTLVYMLVCPQHSKVHLLQTESFTSTFGPKARRKRPHLPALDMEALAERARHSESCYLLRLLTHLHVSLCPSDRYKQGEDRDLVRAGPDCKEEARERVLLKGQSKRLWNELYKVRLSWPAARSLLTSRSSTLLT